MGNVMPQIENVGRRYYKYPQLTATVPAETGTTADEFNRPITAFAIGKLPNASPSLPFGGIATSITIRWLPWPTAASTAHEKSHPTAIEWLMSLTHSASGTQTVTPRHVSYGARDRFVNKEAEPLTNFTRKDMTNGYCDGECGTR